MKVCFLLYFLTCLFKQKVTRDPKQLTFRYRLSANAFQNFSVHAVVLYEEQIAIDKIGNELVIVSVFQFQFLLCILHKISQNYAMLAVSNS